MSATGEPKDNSPSRLSFALVTVKFERVGDGTRLTVTDQVAAYGGRSMIDGHRAGFSAALDNLHEELRGLNV